MAPAKPSSTTEELPLPSISKLTLLAEAEEKGEEEEFMEVRDSMSTPSAIATDQATSANLTTDTAMTTDATREPLRKRKRNTDPERDDLAPINLGQAPRIPPSLVPMYKSWRNAACKQARVEQSIANLAAGIKTSQVPLHLAPRQLFSPPSEEKEFCLAWRDMQNKQGLDSAHLVQHFLEKKHEGLAIVTKGFQVAFSEATTGNPDAFQEGEKGVQITATRSRQIPRNRSRSPRRRQQTLPRTYGQRGQQGSRPNQSRANFNPYPRNQRAGPVPRGPPRRQGFQGESNSEIADAIQLLKRLQNQQRM